MANTLLSRVRKKDKRGNFTRTQTAICYPTNFATLDYRNGYMVQVRDMSDNFVMEYPSVGIVGGTNVTVIGKSGTAKTTFCVQAASRIVRPFENGLVMHYDLEQALSYTRIKNITGYTQYELDEKYILKQERSHIEDIFDSIMMVCQEKEENPDEYTYDTGLRNEFNEPIKAYVPTVFIIDSIPTISSKEAQQSMEGSTYASRVAKAIAQFYRKLISYIKEFNIIIFAINHINAKIEISPFAKTQPQLMYLKMDESLPGGNSPIYYAHNLIKFVTVDKYNTADDGFDGFKVRAELIKSRTNKAGQFAHLVYNQELGFDPIMTQYEFAREYNLIEGRNPSRYFTGFKDDKFDSRKFREAFLESPGIQRATFETAVPLLTRQLSKVDPNETVKAMSKMEMFERLVTSQDGEFTDEDKVIHI